MRRRLVPRVVQTSAMDCGPAALAALLRGHRIAADVATLRARCATDVDGTSIAALADASREHGLPLTQRLLPPEHVGLGPDATLPLIAVVTAPGDVPHFAVLWRARGPLVQVLDPACGRRWMRRRTVVRWLWRHQATVPRAAWESWSAGPAMRDPLARRLRRLGVGRRRRRRLLAGDGAAAADLDAAARATAAVARWGRRGRALARLAAAGPSLPEAWRAATPDADAVRLRGALVLCPDPDAAVARRRPRPGRPGAALARARAVLRAALPGPARPVVAGAATFGAAALVVQAALLAWVLRGDGGHAGLAAMAALAGGLALLRLTVARHEARAGRAIEERLRRAIVDRVPRLPSDWFRTRPASDLAARGHALHELRTVPVLLSQALRATAEVILVGIALALLIPLPWWTVALGLPLVVATAVAGAAVVRGADLRVEEQGSAISRFLLDCLLGAGTLRAHRAQPAVAVELASRLGGWAAAARRTAWLTGAAALAEGAVAWTLALAALAAAGDATTATGLVVVAGCFVLPLAAERLGQAARPLPRMAVLAGRLREPLRAALEPAPAPLPAAAAGDAAGVTIALDGVAVAIGPRPVLHDLTATIGAGEQVALVGPTGSGKSTVVDLLLGAHRPQAGRVLVDGAPLDPARLRARTAWAGPAVTLWDLPLAANVVDPALPSHDPAAALRAAGAEPVVRAHGDRPVGFAGARLSGGEAQRVRLARALARERPALVLLDEALRGLDRPARATLLRRVRERWPGATVVCVTHDLETALDFPRVLVLTGGRLVEEGDPARLAADPGSRLAAALAARDRVDDELARWSSWRIGGDGTTTATSRPGAARGAGGEAVGGRPSPSPSPAADPVATTLRLAGMRPSARRIGRVRARLDGAPTATVEPRLAVALRRARVRRWTAAVGLVTLARYALYLGAWIACVRHGAPLAVVAGLVAALTATTALQTGLVARTALQVVGAVHGALAAAALRAAPERMRVEGIGGLLARLQEARALEATATHGVLAGLLAVVEIAVAGTILVAAGALLLALLLVAWTLALVAAGVAAVRAREAWTGARIAGSVRLVEGLLGHRTVAHDGWPPAAGHDAPRLARRMDAQVALLGAVGAGGWLTGAVALLALGGAGGAALGAAVAGVVLATTGLARAAASTGALAAGVVAWRRIRPLLDAGADEPVGEAPAAAGEGPLLRGRDLRWGPPERPARAAELTIRRGDCVVVRGPSGAGKSTLCRVLAGLEPPTAGAVETRGRVVLVPQVGQDHVLLGPLAFNLLLGVGWPAAPEAVATAERLARELGLGPLLDRMPAGIQQLVGETGWRLSDGERSLIAVARALLRRPDVLILDESLAPLDHDARRHVLDLAVRHAGAVLLVAHD